MFTGIHPVLAFALGALSLGIVAVPVLLWRERRTRRLAAERTTMEAEAERALGIVGASPDGIFVWDRAAGSEGCSRKLAVLLGLPAGTQSRFADVCQRFAGEVRGELETAVQDLRRAGKPFNIILPLGDARTIQAVGTLARNPEGRALTEILWMRDVTTLAGSEPAPRGDGVRIEGTLKAVLDSLPVPVWLRKSDFGIAFANRASADLQGIVEAAGPLAREARNESRPLSQRRQVAGGGPVLDVTETPLGEDGMTLGYGIDRSGVEETQRELQRQAAAHQQVLDTLSVAIAIYGADKHLAYFNRTFAEVWRVDEAWLARGPTLVEVLDHLRERRRLPEVADARAFRAAQMALFDILEQPQETLLHLPDGRTFRSTVTPHVTGGLIFTYEDVSGRLELERSFKTLNAVQRETIDNLHEGVAVFGSDGRLKLTNPTFARIWELARDDLDGALHVSDFVERLRPVFADEPDWPARKARVLARLMSREIATGRLRRGDGRIVQYANVPLPDGAVLLTYLDVTDSVRVEEALRQRTQALQDANRLKSEFIANVSHEVRTPLTSIIGFAEILNEGYFGELNKRQSDYARGILESSRNLMSLLVDILDLASIEAGTMRLEPDAVEVHSMLADVLKLVQERARRKELHLAFDCPPDIGWISADERRLKQVMFHLLSNAITFTPKRGGIRLSAARENESVLLAVSDTGVGIPEADRDRVLKAFERGGEGEHDPAGAGLGLSLVKNFVELHGGSLAIKSAPNRGTTVTCRLPAGGVGARDAFRA